MLCKYVVEDHFSKRGARRERGPCVAKSEVENLGLNEWRELNVLNTRLWHRSRVKMKDPFPFPKFSGIARPHPALPHWSPAIIHIIGRL